MYWRASAVLLAVLLAAGCDHGKRKVQPQPPPPRQSFLALDREHQRLIRDYEPVSSTLTGYELAFRYWRLGRLSEAGIRLRAHAYRIVVMRAVTRLRRDRATGETARAKRLLVEALQARAAALATPPTRPEYRTRWNRAAAKARAGLTVLQDIRDRARLIPLPEDAVS